MKKAYVKVKPKSTKKSSGYIYIVAAVLSAVLCAVVFSFVLKPDLDMKDDVKIDLTEVTPEEIAQVSEPIEIVVPQKTEIAQAPPEKEVVAPKAEEAEQVASLGGNLKFLVPAKGEIINEYSGTKPVKSKTTGDWQVHSGIDIKAPMGSDVVCPADGVVILCENNKLTGQTVAIEHSGGFVSTLYNMQDIHVNNGQKLKEGDVIGTVGNSALKESAEEPHVHFELKKNGSYVNPKDFMK